VEEYGITGSQYVSKMCFVCGTENKNSLKAQFLEAATGEVIGVFSPTEVHQSYPGRLHGGVSAAILDELIGRAINVEEPETFSVTIELNTRYRKPVPYDQAIKARARVTKNTHRMYEGSGEIVLEDGTVAVEATGKYIKLPVDRIAPADFDSDVDDVIYADPRPTPSTISLGGGCSCCDNGTD